MRYAQRISDIEGYFMKTATSNQEISLTIFLYAKGKKYIGVCLELDIIDEDIDLDVLKNRMRERVESYVTYVSEKKKNVNLLNRPAPKEYWEEFFKYLQSLQDRKGRTHSSPKEASVESFPLLSLSKA